MRLRAWFQWLVACCLFATSASGVAGAYNDFFAALTYDRPVVLRQLLERGFDPNTLSEKGEHGVMLGVREGSFKSVLVLLSAAQVKAEHRNAVDESPLMLAAIRGQLEVCKGLVGRGGMVNKDGWTPLHYAASSAQLEIMKLLLTEGANVNSRSPNDTTPLMMAAMYGSTDAVKILLDAGADTTLINMKKMDAAAFARQVGREDALRLIERSQATGLKLDK